MCFCAENTLYARCVSPEGSAMKPGSPFMEKTVLIVDDAAPVRELLASALSKRGYSVTTAESAQAALDKLQGELLSCHVY